MKLESEQLRVQSLKNHFIDTVLEPISRELKIENPLFNICVGVWAWEQDATNTYQKMRKKISASFDTNVVLVGSDANMILNEKPAKNENYVG